jgi:hypothetical protein
MRMAESNSQTKIVFKLQHAAVECLQVEVTVALPSANSNEALGQSKTTSILKTSRSKPLQFQI